MADFCDDNRFKLIEKYKQKLIDETNIESAPDEMKVLDDIMFRFWQMGWLNKLEQTAQQWIPCSERLPSEGENVLLCDTRFGNVAIGKLIRYNTSCCWEVDHWDCDIEDWQAWKPLPEPWKGEEQCS